MVAHGALLHISYIDDIIYPDARQFALAAIRERGEGHAIACQILGGQSQRLVGHFLPSSTQQHELKF